MLPHPSGHVLLVAILDNLGKGAAGAAIQNLNQMLGLEETTGLGLGRITRSNVTGTSTLSWRLRANGAGAGRVLELWFARRRARARRTGP